MKIIGDQSLVVDALKKTPRENKMTVIEDLKEHMPILQMPRICGISFSSYYYKSAENHVDRLDPLIKENNWNLASERITSGHRRVRAALRNQGINVNRKSAKKVLKDSNISLPDHKQKGRRKSRNLVKPTEPDQLWGMDITYIPTKPGMTYPMCIKDYFTKELQVYRDARSCMAKDGVTFIENAVLTIFNGSVPEDIGNIESFHDPIKTDCIWFNEFKNFIDASIAKSRAFTDCYECRSHSPIDYLHPREFRRRFRDDPMFMKKFEKKENEVTIYD